MTVNVDVIGQKLKIATNTKVFIESSHSFVKFIFNLADGWEDLTCFAQFKQGSNSYNQFLDDNNSVYLPSQIEEGTCEIILHGDNNGIDTSSEALEINIKGDVLIVDDKSTEISRSLYSQLITRLNALVALADNGEIPAGTLESEVVDARSGFSTLGDAVRACAKGIVGTFPEFKSYVMEE